MKTNLFSFVSAAIIAGYCLCQVSVVVAQGNLNPSGPPAPTMKTLQQLWDKMGLVETQCVTLQSRIQALETQNNTLTTYLLRMAETEGLGLDWVFTTIDGVGADITGEDTCLALDTNGYPAISYYHRSSGDLMLARFTGDSWHVETVDTGGTSDVGRKSSLAFSPVTGYPAISYYDDTDQNLRYAVKDATGWTASTVASTGDVGSYSSLAFRGNGAPSIAYYDFSNQRLRLAWWRPDVVGGWEFHTVDDLGNVGRACSLAVRPQAAELAITYAYRGPTGTGGKLKIATITYKGWDLYPAQTSTIDADIGPEVYHTSLVFTPNSQPAVCYHRFSTSSLNYAEFNGSTWQISTIDDKNMAGAYCRLAFTPAGRPAVSYYAQSLDDLRYAEYDGGSWRIMTVGGTGSFGLGSSLVILPNGMPGISFYSSDDTCLRYAELRSYRLLPSP